MQITTPKLLFLVFLPVMVVLCQAEPENKQEVENDWGNVRCGRIYKCDSGSLFHHFTVRNQRCVWVYSSQNAVGYEIVYKKFTKTGEKKSVASTLAPDSGIFISAFFAEHDRIGQYMLKNEGKTTINGNSILLTAWSNHFLSDDSTIHFIEVSAITKQRPEAPAALYSNYGIFTPNMGKFCHPPATEEIFQSEERPIELSMYILLPPSNVIELPLEQTTMKITLKRVSPTGGLPRCELQKVELRTLNLSDVFNPVWTKRNEICDDRPIASLTFFDVGIIVVRSIREQKDIRRAFEVVYTQ